MWVRKKVLWSENVSVVLGWERPLHSTGGRGGGGHLPYQLVTVPAVGSRGPTWAAMPPRPAASPPLLACVPVVHVMDS